MSLSISTQILCNILGLPNNSKPVQIIQNISELVAFKKYHKVCKESVYQLNAQILQLRRQIQMKINEKLCNKIQEETNKLRNQNQIIRQNKKQVIQFDERNENIVQNQKHFNEINTQIKNIEEKILSRTAQMSSNEKYQDLKIQNKQIQKQKPEVTVQKQKKPSENKTKKKKHQTKTIKIAQQQFFQN